MPTGRVTRTAGRAATRIPGLKRVPVLKLLAAADIASLAHEHYIRLDRHERRRLFELLREGRGRPRSLPPAKRRELSELVARMEPRLLAGLAAERLSPVPLPHRVVHGPSRSR